MKQILHYSVALFVLALLGQGCGQIIDKDNIRIARLDDRYITRGDLSSLIRNMPDKDRPRIRNKGDLLSVLNQYIDSEIKLPLGQQLAEEGKINVPRELAREQFFQQAGEDSDLLRSIWAMEVPEGGQSTPLMEVYNLTATSLRARKDFIDQETDRIHERMLGDEGVAYLAIQAFREGTLTPDQESLEREYQVRKADLTKFEWMRFLAIRIPAEVPDAATQAAAARKRIDEGASFDAVLDAILVENPNFAIESEIENNPDLERFRGFWETASGAEEGDILGPLYLPEYQQVNPQTGEAVVMPASWLVLQVLEHEPERTLTLEEAYQQIAPTLLVAEMMKQLREERGVEIYEDKLPDPSRVS